MSDSDVLLDKALDSYPMAPLPEEFVAGTMAQIESPYRRRIEMLDLAVVASMIGVVSTAPVVWWTLNRVDPLWLDRVRLEILRAGLATADAQVMTAVLMMAGSLVLALILLPALVLITERRGVAAV